MSRDEYNTLINTINHHMYLYYNEDDNEISDYDYDQLMLQLKEIEIEHPEWVFPSSPTQKIGGVAKREAGVKITHDVPMLSIEDVFTKEDVITWVNKVHTIHPDCTFSVETKIDGLSLTTRYNNEKGKLKLQLAETRGNGIEGEDVTANTLMIPDVKKLVDLPYENMQLRGEVYMNHEDFERYNAIQIENGKREAANSRNLAAGTLRQLDPNITKERGLHIFIFNVQQGPDAISENHIAGLDLLASKGIPVVYHKLCKTAEDVIQTIDQIAEMRNTLPYDIDGAVVKINETKYRDDFPAGRKYASGHIAYKYPPEERVVVMDDIDVAVGRTGKLTFTGVFHDKETGKPAHLCGTSVSRVTLHNQDYIHNMEIGVGGAYTLYKSGEIIPKLNGCVEKPQKVFIAPFKCPVCNTTLIREEEDTADIRCINPNCPAQLSRTIAYFTSLDCMNILSLGDTIVDTLIQNGFLNNCADLYKLKNYREELIERGLIGKEKNTDKILTAIEKSKENDAYKLLTGLAIRNVGKSTAKELMKHYTGIQELMTATVEELTTIEDIGSTTATCIVDFFANQENKEIIWNLEKAGVNMQVKEQEGTSNKLSGLTFVVTGTLQTMGRKEIEDLIAKNGGKCSGSVSKKTNYVVVGENAGSKLEKANELGISILSEEDLLKMI